MWTLVLLTLINACVPNQTLIHEMVIKIGGIPINTLDWALVIAAVVAAFYPRAQKFQADQVHPLLWWLTALFFLGTVMGSIRAFSGPYQIEIPWYMRNVRHYAAFPVSLVLGYALLPRPKSGRSFTYTMILAGILTSTMIVLFFKNRGEELAGTDFNNINELRTIDYVTSFAGLAAAFLIYAVLSGIRLMPTWLAWAIAGVCVIGVFATFTRSDWLSTMAGILAVYVIVPRERRAGLAIRGFVAMVILFSFVWGAIFAVSAITGADFAKKAQDRVASILPWTERASEKSMKAWDTRLPGIQKELEMWAASPLMGQGFGSQTPVNIETHISVRHNAWTSILSEAGLLGFIPVVIAFGAMLRLGRKLVKAHLDHGTMLVGAMAYIAAVHFFVLGMSTMSFNNERVGIVVGVLCGMVLRARAMQLTMARLWAGYLPDANAYGGDGSGQPLLDGYDYAYAG
jgi:hypothetical protein